MTSAQKALELNRGAAANPPQPSPVCCISRGFFWDDVILYASHTQWNTNPPSAFWDGPVVHVIPGLESAFTKIAGAL
jgi:hypothetical protein